MKGTETSMELDTEKSKLPDDICQIKAEAGVESPPKSSLPSFESGPWDDLKDEFQVCLIYFVIST